MNKLPILIFVVIIIINAVSSVLRKQAEKAQKAKEPTPPGAPQGRTQPSGQVPMMGRQPSQSSRPSPSRPTLKRLVAKKDFRDLIFGPAQKEPITPKPLAQQPTKPKKKKSEPSRQPTPQITLGPSAAPTTRGRLNIDQLLKSKQDLKRAIVLSEILAPPLSLRPPDRFSAFD